MTATAFQLQPEGLIPDVSIGRAMALAKYRVVLAEDDDERADGRRR
jgi:hypothetical protein